MCNVRASPSGRETAAEAYVPTILRGSKVKVRREARAALRKEEMKVVEKGAEKVVSLVDEFLARNNE